MEIWQALILGVVEGLTEFLPISSTFHLIFAGKLLNVEPSNFLKMFEVFIQAGAIIAVLFLYGKELWRDRELDKKIILSFIPTAIIGFLLHSVIKNFFFETDWLMLTTFAVVGLIFIAYEKWYAKHPSKGKNIADLTTKQAILIGLGQALAVLPGVSRAGAVIITMMILGQKRSEAAKYSFLLAVPTICAAAGYDALKMIGQDPISSQEFGLMGIGFATAFITAFFVLKWFIAYLQKNTLTNFGIYRLVATMFLLGFFFMV